MLSLHIAFMSSGDAATVDNGNYGQHRQESSCGQSVNH